MKIEVWSDFVCPFCYIGKRRLEVAALKRIEFKVGISQYYFASKYGFIEEAKRNNVQWGNHAASMGFKF